METRPQQALLLQRLRTAVDTNTRVGCVGRHCQEEGHMPNSITSTTTITTRTPAEFNTTDYSTHHPNGDHTHTTAEDFVELSSSNEDVGSSVSSIENSTSFPPYNNPLEEFVTMTAGFNIEIDTMQPLEHPQLGQSIGEAALGMNSTTQLPPSSTPSGQAGEELLKTVPFDQIIFVVCASSIIAATIFGNVLVIIAVFSESKLRKVGNFFIVSLAVSDLLVGLFVTPVALVYNLLGSWTFGSVFCDIWIAMDVVCCTASIVNLCVISFDRYNAITQPLRYALRRTASRAIMVIGLIWTYSVFIAVPPFLGWSDARDHVAAAAGQCMISQNVGYTIFSTVGAYYMPLIVMMVMYLKVFRATQKRKRNWIPLVRRESYEPSMAVGGTKRSGSCSSMRKARVLISVADSADRDDIHDELVVERRHGRRRAPKMSLLMTSFSLQSSGPKVGVTIQVPSSQESLATTPSPEYRCEQVRYPCSSIDETSEKDAPSMASSSTRDPISNHRKLLLMASSTESAGDISDESGYEGLSPQISPASSLFARRMSPSHQRNYYKTVSRSSSEKRFMFQKRLNPSFTTSTETTTTPTTGSEETLCGDLSSTGPPKTTAEGRVRFSFSRRSCKFQFRVESEIQEEELSRGEAEKHQQDLNNRKLQVESPRHETSVDTARTETMAPVCHPVVSNGTTRRVSNESSVPMTPTTDATLLAQSRHEKALTIERGRRRQRNLRRRRKNRISLNQERRAAKTLGIIMGCFIICWLPFFLVELVRPFCTSCHFHPNLLKALTWLGYLNSALNPIIYTFFNQDFRKGFQRIMCCSVKR